MRTLAAPTQAFLAVCIGAIVTAIVLAIVLPTGGGPSSKLTGSQRLSALGPRHGPLPTRPTPRPHGIPVAVRVGTRPAGRPIPTDFVGLSIEAGELHRVAGWPQSSDFATLLRAVGPGVLRFGGPSADRRSGWLQAGQTPPRWETRPITEPMLAQLASLAKRAGWKVLLSLNLGHYDPHAAAQEAAAAKRLLRGYLLGVTVGNEPDRYSAQGLRPASWSRRDYLAEVSAYRKAIEAAAPGVRILGPDSSGTLRGLPWVRRTAATGRAPALTTHFYPLSKCGYTPVVSELLSPVLREKDQAMLSTLSAISQAAKTPVLLDETNNISCRGEPGVSDSFASALWAAGYLGEAMSSGISGLYFTDLLAEPSSYSPLAAHGTRKLAGGQLLPNPEWYALLLAHRLIGWRPASARVVDAPSYAGGPVLTAAAFTGPRGEVHVLLDDYAEKGTEPLKVHLRVAGSYRGGPILRLLGPYPAALTGTTFAGRAVGRDGSWRPRLPVPAVYGHGAHLSVQMPPSTAALITLLPQRR